MIYVQLIAQLLTEDHHGKHNEGHEALRRQSYARQMLDAVGHELKHLKVYGLLFRSAVLNPTLQRQMRGVPDVYTPSVRGAISGNLDPTIEDVTLFYLSKDPVEHKNISLFWRNLLYSPQMRWFLQVVGRAGFVKSIKIFDNVYANHDKLMEALKEDDGSSTVSSEEASLTKTEIEVILDENLDGFYEHMLDQVVRTFLLLHPTHR